jgi:hypothetical protein
MKKSTYSVRSQTVSTVKKSQAAMPCAWTRRNDRLAGVASSFGELLAVGGQEVRDGAQSAHGLALEVGAPARRPEKHERADPRTGHKAPAFEAVRDRGVRRRTYYQMVVQIAE